MCSPLGLFGVLLLLASCGGGDGRAALVGLLLLAVEIHACAEDDPPDDPWRPS